MTRAVAATAKTRATPDRLHPTQFGVTLHETHPPVRWRVLSLCPATCRFFTHFFLQARVYAEWNDFILGGWLVLQRSTFYIFKRLQLMAQHMAEG